jgi:hypothetical protein
MLEGLQAKEGQTMEDAVRQFDAELLVSSWRVFPGQDEPDTGDRDPNAPYWWTSDEDASASFLAAVGQVL